MRFLVLAVALPLSLGCGPRSDEPSFPTAPPAPRATPSFDSGVVHAPHPPEVLDTSPSSPSEPLRVGGSVTAPVLVTQVQPVFPARCSSSRFEGLFIFEAVIDSSGRVASIRTIRSVSASPPCPEAEVAVREALARWHYKPAMFAGIPVSVYLTITISPHHR